ncbi:MAG: hypothetical protein ACJ790_08455 [Myxococcaceae bacterium]
MTWTYLLDCPHCAHPNRQGTGRIPSPFQGAGGAARPKPVTVLCKNCGEEFSAELTEIRSVPAGPVN